MKKTTILLAFLFVVHYTFAQKSSQCKWYTFSCPATTAKICNNSHLYTDLESSNGFDGMYTKQASGCWVVSGNAITIPKENVGLVTRLRKLFGNNSVKAKK